MRCPNCGNTVPDNMHCSPYCGVKLKDNGNKSGNKKEGI